MGFRPFIYRLAVRNGLAGYVRNRGDAGVEILLEGDSLCVDRFMVGLTDEKPPLAQIEKISCTELSGKNQHQTFTIFKSSQEAETSGSIIPPDIAICNQCLKELRDPNDPRFEYFFITCTDCGPRFTIIERLPYDRENTTMKEFPLCGFCKKEYEDPANRRFHAQTVACPTCGPKAYLTTNTGEPVQTQDPVRLAGNLLIRRQCSCSKGLWRISHSSFNPQRRPLRTASSHEASTRKTIRHHGKKPRCSKRVCRSGFEGKRPTDLPCTPSCLAH